MQEELDRAKRFLQLPDQPRPYFLSFWVQESATMYLAALCRKPAAEEMTASQKHIAQSKERRQALEDVGWAILNSKEFLFQH